ncbi:helix-turn-helix transcriptional regulator [Nonomuraea sp. NPDC003727]
MLRGRAAEVAALERALSRAREGRGGAVVIRGEAGAGKTTLLESVSSSAGESRLLWAWGVESEAELPYAGLQVLFREVRDLADRLPEQHARALRGLIDSPYGAAGDRFLVGAAALTLLGELAEEQPVVVLIDDAHWLDLESAEALLFAARRLGAERVAMIFAVRDGSPVFDRPGVPVVELGPLSDEAGAALLADHAPDLHVSARQGLLSQAQGNPLALVELVGALSPAQRDGIEPVDEHEIGVMPVSWRIQRIFDARIGALPAPARTLLTIAAADDTGDPALIVRAGQRMGASVADLGPAADAGLIRVAEGRLRFRHPLARAAAYQSAPLSQRMAAHHALAETVGDGGRRAWHLAAATVGHDEQAATELERNAELFRSRGGLAAVAAAYRRAAQLTEDRDTRGRRLAAAAMAANEAGLIEHAAALAGEALPYVRDPAWIARLALTRARLEHARGRPESARTLLLDAATHVAPLDRQAGALMTFEAMAAAWDSPVPEAAAGDTAARLSGLDVPDAFLLRGADGLRLLATGDIASGAAALRDFAAHVTATRHDRGLSEQSRLQGWEMLLGDHQTVHDDAVALDRECREQGALGALPRVLLRLAHCRLFLGRHHDAHATAIEGLEIARDTGQRHYVTMLVGVLAILSAIDGDKTGCRRSAGEDLPSPAWHAYALGLLDLGFGRYEAAAHRLAGVTAGPHRHVVVAVLSLPEQVEAVARLGGDASEACEQFERWATGTGTPWARAIALRCRALLAPDEQAGPAFEAALAAHAGDGRPFELARTHLLYGEWLRRAKRRGAARRHLGSALESFERMRAAPWAERARSELRATGADPLPTAGAGDLVARLTAQELQVVRLAAAGMSNREIGARLFISPRTAGYHLSNAYPKLGVTSRIGLARLDLADNPVI